MECKFNFVTILLQKRNVEVASGALLEMGISQNLSIESL